MGRFKGGRTLPGNPSLLAASPLDPAATMPRYQYRRCRRFHLLLASADLDFPLYPVPFYPCLSTPSLVLSSPLFSSPSSSLLRPTLHAASSIIQAPDAQPLSLFSPSLRFLASTCLGSSASSFLLPLSFSFLFHGEGGLGVTDELMRANFLEATGRTVGINRK